MIYTLIISLLIEKPFYLLSPQIFSFQIVSEFIDIYVKFSNFMSWGWAFDSLFCPEGRVFVHNDCPRGRVFAPFKLCPGGLSRGVGVGVITDEIDTCITVSVLIPAIHHFKLLRSNCFRVDIIRLSIIKVP